MKNNRIGMVLAATLFAAALPAVAQTVAPRADPPQYKVGDRWKFERNDRRTGAKEAEIVRTITAVSAAGIEGTDNESKMLLNPDHTWVESGIAVFKGEMRPIAYPLEVGKKWSYSYQSVTRDSGVPLRWQLDAHVVGHEKVKGPAGEFEAFKIEYKGFRNNDRTGRSARVVQTGWYAPAARAIVRSEYDDTFNNWVQQLVELQLQP